MAGVVYSRWRPSDGRYDYFVADEEPANLNDDLPTPLLSPASKIGVPSIEAGRPIPQGAVARGSGERVRGLMAPVDPSRIVRRTRSLGEVAPPASSYAWAVVAAGAIGAIVLIRKVW